MTLFRRVEDASKVSPSAEREARQGRAPEENPLPAALASCLLLLIAERAQKKTFQTVGYAPGKAPEH